MEDKPPYGPKAPDADDHPAPSLVLGSPQSLARVARELGHSIFQIELPISRTQGRTGYLGPGSYTEGPDFSGQTLQAIESEGWRLEHAGYFYRPRSADTHDRVALNGSTEAFSGETVGVYVFRPAPAGPRVLSQRPRIQKSEQQLVQERWAGARAIARKLANDPRLPIDEKIELLSLVGGEFTWTKGSNCQVVLQGKTYQFNDGREFGDWLLKAVVPRLNDKT